MNRRVLTIILAVLLAVLGTTAVLFYVSKADARALAGQQAVSVLVASKPIPAGTAAGSLKSFLSKENMPAASVPSDALSTIDKDIFELVTSANLAQGQLLTRRMLVTSSTKNALVLPEGKMAVTIPVSGGAGDLKPGFKVAVFNTFTVGGNKNGFTPNGEQLAFGEDKNQATRLLLPKVEVIGVAAEKAKKDGSANFGKFLVTVAVSQAEAEKLIHVLATGTISMAQVNDESKVGPGRGIDTLHLFQGGN